MRLNRIFFFFYKYNITNFLLLYCLLRNDIRLIQDHIRLYCFGYVCVTK